MSGHKYTMAFNEVAKPASISGDPALDKSSQEFKNIQRSNLSDPDSASHMAASDTIGFAQFKELLQYTQKETKRRQDNFMRLIMIQSWQQAQEKAADMIKYYEGMAKIWDDMGNQAKKGEDNIELWAEHMRHKQRNEWLKRDANGNMVDEQEAAFLQHLALVDPLFPKDGTDTELADYMQNVVYDTTQTHDNTRKMIVISEAMEKALKEKAELLQKEVDRLNADKSLSDQERKNQLAEFIEQKLTVNEVNNLRNANIDDEYIEFATKQASENNNEKGKFLVTANLNDGFSP